MKLIKLFKRYALRERPVLKAFNPRIGTSVIPLNNGDEDIFYQYLNNKIHSLSFDGSPAQLRHMIEKLQVKEGVKVQKMRLSDGRLFLHLMMPNQQELRRVIKLI